MVNVPQIELLWWEGCPSTERARAMVRETLDGLGLVKVAIRSTEMRTDEDARERGFRGSPTILIDGEDPFARSDEQVGLSCRVYRRRDGRASPLPDPEELREALAR